MISLLRKHHEEVIHALDMDVVRDGELVVVLDEVSQCRRLVATAIDGNTWVCCCLCLMMNIGNGSEKILGQDLQKPVSVENFCQRMI